jgi:hypothetical protein
VQTSRQPELILKDLGGFTTISWRTSVNDLGLVSHDLGDLARAEEYDCQALAIREKLSPDSLGVAASFSNLAGVEWSRGDLAKAEEYLSQGWVIVKRLDPGSLSEASMLNGLGLS